MYRGYIIILVILFAITVIFTGNILKYKADVFEDMKMTSDKYASEYFGEYVGWESKMIETNPDYKDLMILIEISEKRLYLLNDNQLIKSYAIASGKADTPSPLGSWKIVNKAKWGGGFGTRWMGLNVPWGRYGIHGTNKPNSIGYNASAGCIRMKNKDVEDLYQYVKHNTPVAIINGLHGPFGYGLRDIKPGDIGSDIMEIQRRLRALGYYNNEYLDGKYGPMLERALYDFQKDNNLDKNPHIDWTTYKVLGIILME